MDAARHFACSIKVRDLFAKNINNFGLRCDSDACTGTHETGGQRHDIDSFIDRDHNRFAVAGRETVAAEFGINAFGLNVRVVFFYRLQSDFNGQSGFSRSVCKVFTDKYMSRRIRTVREMCIRDSRSCLESHSGSVQPEPAA